MAAMAPDWGIFSLPRREPHLRYMRLQSPSSPTTAELSRLSCTSPRDSHKALFSPTASGSSLGFYKSPKAKPSKAAPSRPSLKCSQPLAVCRKKVDGINKGVTHSIKRPKPKVVEEKKKKLKMEETARRIKERAPRIPANRSPVKSPSITGQKKRLQMLTPPGVSLLNCEESFVPEPTSNRFFKSRSRAPASVQINKNMKLSAKYKDVSLNQRVGKTFAKKNIGRLVEEKLDQYLQQPRVSKEISEVSPLPSVSSAPRPCPTRVRCSPSPTKKAPSRKARTPSPKKRVAAATTPSVTNKGLNTSLGEELQDMELIMKEWKNDDLKASAGEDRNISKHNSARKLNGGFSPLRRSPRKLAGCASPVRSPRKVNGCASPVRSPKKVNGCASPVRSPRKVNGCASPVRRSPRKQGWEELAQDWESPHKVQEVSTPSKKTHASRAMEKAGASPSRRSPRKQDRSSPQKRVNVEDGEEQRVIPESPSKKVKHFPIFYPSTRLADCKFPSSKNGISFKKSEMDDAQMMIDAGQKEFGAKQCPDCGLLYEVGNSSDDTSHKRYHNHLLTALKYTAWKKERMVREPDHLGGRVIEVSGQDSERWWEKVEEVREVVDKLGFCERSIKTREHTKVFLYVLDQRVVGCLIAEKTAKGYRIVPQKQQMEGSSRLVCCSRDATKVWVGISRLWVLSAMRGKGIASTLVDTMRCNMFNCHILSKDQFAFSHPTEAGLNFAEKYMGRPDFLVYHDF
ncbi:N-acetyltransferase ESCO2-like [Portunus trituberculatus]|uniref:N-acetyltransferase ESCO2-like n=1 Tax=Portunus trituberculatus TaxID=210409 RepID=UPI001E1CEE26|nr:N-acetyltransferase ESCO2-like [Portunus trituberculatus]XP_045119623.1 N-acetyltransferase ESCO2-like [Portunus trituberculatus]